MQLGSETYRVHKIEHVVGGIQAQAWWYLVASVLAVNTLSCSRQRQAIVNPLSCSRQRWAVVCRRCRVRGDVKRAISVQFIE